MTVNDVINSGCARRFDLCNMICVQLPTLALRLRNNETFSIIEAGNLQLPSGVNQQIVLPASARQSQRLWWPFQDLSALMSVVQLYAIY